MEKDAVVETFAHQFFEVAGMLGCVGIERHGESTYGGHELDVNAFVAGMERERQGEKAEEKQTFHRQKMGRRVRPG